MEEPPTHLLHFLFPPWNESNGSEEYIWLNVAFLFHSTHHLRQNECTAHCDPLSLLSLLPTLFLSFVVFLRLPLHANISIPVSIFFVYGSFFWPWIIFLFIFLCTSILIPVTDKNYNRKIINDAVMRWMHGWTFSWMDV